jgi:polysaccharide biosynthesis PFTS motif protein
MSGDTKQDFRFISRFVFTFIDISEIQLKRRMQAHLENPSEYLGKVIIFNNSQKNSLPIWTEDLQALGARVCLMFYSTESEVRFLSGRPPQIEYWGLAQWPEIWCVDKTQKSELLSLDLVSTNNIKVIGYPWWSDDDYVPVSSKKKTLIYFSLEPHISDFSLTPSYSYGFGDPNMAVMTLLDILELSQELGFHVRHKVKRHLNSERFPVYANALEEFQTRFDKSKGSIISSDELRRDGDFRSVYHNRRRSFPKGIAVYLLF